MPYTYACAESGAEECPGKFTTATEDELWKVLELHGREAHGMGTLADWSPEDRRQVQDLIHAA